MAGSENYRGVRFKDKNLVSLSKDILERKFNMTFEVYTGTAKVRPDLIGRSTTKEGDFIVVIGRNKLFSKIEEDVLLKLDTITKEFMPSRILMMNFEHVSPSVKNRLFSALVNEKGSSVRGLDIYDRQQINTMLNEYGDIREEYFPTVDNAPIPDPDEEPYSYEDLDFGPDPEPDAKSDPDPDLEKDKYDKIPFHLDQVEQVDMLNREPIAGSLAQLLNTQIFNRENRVNNSFMIHLQGAWGEGKSTFLQLLGKKLNTGDKKWVIIELNAWQHQHIDPPWWSFLDKIYKQGILKISIFDRPFLLFQEWCRRLTSYKRIPKLVAFSLTIIFSIILIVLWDDIVALLQQGKLKELVESGEESDISDFAAIIGSVFSLIGLIYSFAKFISYPFFLRSPEDAKTFMQRVSDPMEKVRLHFKRLISDYNRMGYDVAIFIDDLDRCDDAFTVKLLEGIQTLFKTKLVLYVVAGDRHWISNCFENHYDTFTDLADEPGQRLGYLFLEKAFQLSIRLPKVSGPAKKAFWEFIINGPKNETKEEAKWPWLLIDKFRNNGKRQEKKNLQDRKEAISDLRSKVDTNQLHNNPGLIKDFEEESGLDPKIIAEAVLAIVNEDSKDVDHLLAEHHKIIRSNPRSIKRLANQYTMNRDILYSERQKFDKNKLFRWLIIQNRYPVYTDWLERNIRNEREAKEIPEELRKITSTELFTDLIFGPDQNQDSIITEEDVKLFTGIYSMDDELESEDLENYE